MIKIKGSLFERLLKVFDSKSLHDLMAKQSTTFWKVW